MKRAVLLIVALICAAVPARAEQRIALVVGNSTYATVTSLDNPGNDAQLIATTLERLGFDVRLLLNATQIDMKRGIAQFGRDLRSAGSDATGLFYYAGHGVQSFGANYLLPSDVALNDAADLDLVGVDAQTVLRQMYSAANQTNIVILDACRNNPFSEIPDFGDPGLAEMQAPRGTFLAYATAPGSVALDGVSGNSPFTSAVVEQMNRPGVAIENMFRQVRVSVLQKTSGLQTPWDASSLTSEFIFNRDPSDQGGGDDGAEQAWVAAQASGETIDLILFLRSYPDSSFADQAQALLTERMRDRAPGERPGDVVVVAEPEPAPASDPVPQSGLTAEEQIYASARADGSAQAFQAYLQAYPEGLFSELARSELARLRQGTAAKPQDLAFADPMASSLPQLSGRSIAEVIGMSPIYPPIPGLPEAVWQNKPCSNCHQWSEAALCEQASRYLVAQSERSLTKPHPFGGGFKTALRDWAAGGCR